MLGEDSDEYAASRASGWQREVDPVTVPLDLRMPLTAVPRSVVHHVTLAHESLAGTGIRTFRREVDLVLAHGRGNAAGETLVVGDHTREVVVQGAEDPHNSIPHRSVTSGELPKL